MQYQLNINIDQASLTAIYAAGQAITIVKSVLTSPTHADVPPIAWLSVRPFVQNLITWNDGFQLYATDTTLSPGERIVVVDETSAPVQFGSNFVFDNSNITTSPALNITNRQPGRLISFGLSQKALVNGQTVSGPLNAVPVEIREWVRFEPRQGETVSIFLDDASPKNGVILDEIADNALVLEMGAANRSANIGYDGASKSFHLVK